MLASQFPGAIILPIFDNPSNRTWSENVDSLLTSLFPYDEIKLFCGRDSFKPCYSGKFQVVEITSLEGISATKMRNEVDASSHFEFRRGVIYALKKQYPRVFPTVDIGVYTDTALLLGRKKERDKWCLPGGFVDQKDESLEAAGSREIKEEADLTIPSSILSYLTSGKSLDWRCKDDTIMTSFLGVKYREEFGKAAAGDDLVEVKWVPFEEVNEVLVENHKWMVNFLLAMLGK
jgi:bifunctional NMN adenylyltransferase/nudix hydrolase